ncbi:hypothetical protein [Brevibacillus borstelensis]|uniref:hypothetical protein n=1 Tax=Brevibacillus borstelensis TaxID=45462 RepID=UPI0030C5F49A
MNKKLVLSVLSTAVLTSMAASAMAKPSQGFYIGGDVDKFYSPAALLKDFKVGFKEILSNAEDVVYVNADAKAAKFLEYAEAADPNAVLKQATQKTFGDNVYKVVGSDATYDPSTDPDLPPGTEPGDLVVENVSAIDLYTYTVKFNKAVDEVTAENFSIPGLTVETATLSEDKKTVKLSLAGVEVSKDYKLTVTNVKIDAKVQPDVTFDFKSPTQNDLFKPEVEAKDTVLKADNASQTLVTFTLKNAAGEILEDAKDVEVQFSSTFGSFAEKKVTVQKGKATVLFGSETLSSDKVADITALVIEAKDKNLIGLKATTSIYLSPNPDAIDPTTGALMGEASGYQADRVLAYFNKKVAVEDFVDKDGNIDPTKAAAKVFTESNNDGTGGKEVKVIGLLPVSGNEKALQLVLDKADGYVFPLVDNANVRVEFTDKRGSVPVESKRSFKLTDARVPSMLGVEREGLNKLKVTFSEPVINSGNADDAFKNSALNLNNWSIDGKSLTSKVWGDKTSPRIEVGKFIPKKGTDERHVVTITLGADAEGKQIYFKPGTHSLQGANIGDWAAVSDPFDNVMNTQTLDFDIPVDNGAPGAVVEVQSPEQYLVTFDKNLNQDADDLAKLLQLQVYDRNTSQWVPVDRPAVKITNISEDDSNYKFLVQTTLDWTVVHNTKTTNKNYYNYDYRLYLEAGKVISASNGVANAEIKLPLGGAMTFPDVTSPTINSIDKTPGTEEGTSYDVTMSEPVKIGSGNDEGDTPSQNQGAETGDEQGLIPVPTAEFIKKDKSVTIPANIGSEFVDKENKVIRVTPTKELDAGEWTLVVRSISDDVGNTAASATKEFTVVKEVEDTAFKVVWSYAEHGSNIGQDDYDFVFIKFSKAGATTGDHKNILKTANYKLNGKPLPTGTQIFGDIAGYDDNDDIVDSITIRLPKNSITRPDTTVINISEYLESTTGDLVGDAGIKKLPYYSVEGVLDAVNVDRLIVALPSVDKLTLADKEKVAAAREAYDKLTADQKALVKYEATLKAAEDKIAELEKVTTPVDTTAIDDAVKAANDAKKDVKISADGSDVLTTEKWVTQAVNDNLDKAIQAANDAKATAKTEQDVTDAVTALEDAVKAYNAEKKDGTKVDAPDTTAIDDAVKAANDAKKDVKISADGSDVLTTEKWVTQKANDDLDKAIQAANDAKATAKTEQDVTDAVTALEDAVKAYNAEKKDGTQTP